MMGGYMFIASLVLLNVTKTNAETPTELLGITEDCVNTYTYFGDELACNNGHELYRYTSLNNEFNGITSCSTCECNGYTGTDPNATDIPYEETFNTGPQCCSGWSGTVCDVCQSVDVCPDIDIDGNGTMTKASSCTSTQIIPASTEEAEQGKKFSCYCGGGEDAISEQICNLQGQYNDYDDPDVKGATTTRFDWVFSGLGTSSSPGSIALEMNAGIHGMTYAPSTAPTKFDYFYPIVWNGTMDNCVITTGYCMNIPDTDVGSQQCFNFACDDTKIDCPPTGLKECPGGANDCDDVPGTDEKYQMHKVILCVFLDIGPNNFIQYLQCNGLPVAETAFQISCLQEANDDGSFVCYYTQPGGYNPMSMTCNVGNCLYDDTTSI